MQPSIRAARNVSNGHEKLNAFDAMTRRKQSHGREYRVPAFLICCSLNLIMNESFESKPNLHLIG
jgi:hypothetical protein